jgi:hypothetical protein
MPERKKWKMNDIENVAKPFRRGCRIYDSGLSGKADRHCKRKYAIRRRLCSGARSREIAHGVHEPYKRFYQKASGIIPEAYGGVNGAFNESLGLAVLMGKMLHRSFFSAYHDGCPRE